MRTRSAPVARPAHLAHSIGSQVEFDKPSELLKKENGRFRSLVDESGDKDLLYATANQAGMATNASE